ncbi:MULTISPECIES: CsbD family protein [Bacillaceae]|uniref:CsbD family protein n=1 Tax=Bacillaceae TaxID=186817 RepID=UPI001C566B64|nr:CsbD family protein [Rossellomorea sp. YZS02]MBW3112461.1 CsbD family protein [Bacillus sp. MCCB 382]MDX8342592.1 CsbD family protein [Rossellomorea sp. YZS02]
MRENHDQVKGKTNQAKGEVKKGLGKLTNDHSMIAEGERDKDKGKMQEKVGNAKESFKKNW